MRNLALLLVAACTSAAPEKGRTISLADTCPGVATLRAAGPGTTAATVAQGQEQQGQLQQGCQQQGTELMGAQPETPLNSSYAGWWNRRFLRPAQISGGQLLADGGALAGAAVAGSVLPSSSNGTTIWTYLRSAWPDPTYADGSVWLYDVQLWDSATNALVPLCGPDAQGVAAAIPLAATWDATGARVESTAQFTFACTSGALAKCIRWGYRPWLADASGSSQVFVDLHEACTRMARADYCGDGRSWTRTGTTINVWDTGPAPGPFQQHGPQDPTFFFEAGWSPQGAVCLSKERWATLDPRVAQDCPGRLIPPGAETPDGTVCESPQDASGFDASVMLFDESQLNVAQ